MKKMVVPGIVSLVVLAAYLLGLPLLFPAWSSEEVLLLTAGVSFLTLMGFFFPLWTITIVSLWLIMRTSDGAYWMLPLYLPPFVVGLVTLALRPKKKPVAC